MAGRVDSLTLRKALASRLRRARQDCKLTQEELAFNSGLHRNYISLLERGLKSPTIDVLERLARAVGLEPSQLLKRAESSFKRKQSNG